MHLITFTTPNWGYSLNLQCFFLEPAHQVQTRAIWDKLARDYQMLSARP